MRKGDLPPHVFNLKITDTRLELVVDRLVHALVLRDAAQEVGLGFLARHVCVVWVAGGDLETDVCVDD